MSESLQRKIKFGYAQIGGVNLHYATAGSGKNLVVLLHGFPEFWYSWRHQIISLSTEYTVVAPDMRGYNLSDKPPHVSDYEIDNLVDDVTSLIRHFGKKQAAVIGHDWGAGIAWAVADKNPEYVSKLACMQVPPQAVWKKNQTFRQFLASWYMFFFQVPKLPEWLLSRNDNAKLVNGLQTKTAKSGVFSDEDVSAYRKSWNEPGALTGALNYYRANILKRLLGKGPKPKKITVPTLFIYGEKDHAILPVTVAGIGDFIDAEYTELRIPDAAHWVQNEAAEEVTEALQKFLAD